jgi:hypothetical protein
MTFKTIQEKIIAELQRNILAPDTNHFLYPVSAEFDLYKHFDNPISIDLTPTEKLVVKYSNLTASKLAIVPWIVIKNKAVPAGFLTVKKKRFGNFIFYMEDYSILKPEFQGRGLMQKVYQGLGESGVNLVADGSHSDGARSLWNKLSQTPSLVVWAIFGDTFIEDEKNPKKDYVYAIQLSNKFKSKKNTKELTKAIFKNSDGKISSREVYNDDNPENLTSLILTKRGGQLDQALTKLDEFGAAELPYKETDDREIKILYQAINSILLQK